MSIAGFDGEQCRVELWNVVDLHIARHMLEVVKKKGGFTIQELGEPWIGA